MPRSKLGDFMSTENGSLKNGSQAVVSVGFSNQAEVEFLIDTGFNGFLCLPRSILTDLNLQVMTSTMISGVGNYQEEYDVVYANIVWMGEVINKVLVLVNDGDDYLLGTALLENKELYINYKTGEVVINQI